jgi:hypothetical protein
MVDDEFQGMTDFGKKNHDAQDGFPERFYMAEGLG